MQRTNQDLQRQGQSVERIKRTLFDDVQVKVNHLEEKLRMFGDHMDESHNDRSTGINIHNVPQSLQ